MLKTMRSFIKSTPQNHKMGPVIGSKMGPCRKSSLFEGPLIFWAPKWPSAGASCHLMGPKNLGPLEKSRFSAGPIRFYTFINKSDSNIWYKLTVSEQQTVPSKQEPIRMGRGKSIWSPAPLHIGHWYNNCSL